MTNVPADSIAGPSQEFHHRVAATPETLIELRDALGRWAESLGMPPEQREDLILATYEAMANSAEHAYRDAPGGLLDLHAAVLDGEVTVTVTDFGAWKPPEQDDGLRGRGLVLIDGLALRNELVHRADGTTVSMTWRIGDPGAA